MRKPLLRKKLKRKEENARMNEGLLWHKDIHNRFSRDDRARVLALLLVHQRTNFTLKDLLFAWIIPLSLHLLRVPLLCVTNLPFSIRSGGQLHGLFDFPIEEPSVALRKNGLSKGFGYLRCVRFDDFDSLIGTRQVHCNGLKLYFLVTSKKE